MSPVAYYNLSYTWKWNMTQQNLLVQVTELECVNINRNSTPTVGIAHPSTKNPLQQVAFKDWTLSLTFLNPCYKMLILNFNWPPCSHFSFFAKVISLTCSSSEDISEYNISWSYIDWCKVYIHLRSLNVHHFGMVAAMALKIVVSRSS
jgi:hypothetical protein